MDELAAIRASQAGDRQAFGTLVERYYQSVYRLAYHYAGNHADADDVCQQTFLIALEKIGGLRDGTHFEGWIWIIAANLLRRQARRAGRRERWWRQRDRDTGAQAADHQVTAPWDGVREQERAEAVRTLLRQMPEKVRLPAILVLMEGRSQKDAADLLHCSPATVCRQVEQARDLLRAGLRHLIE